MPESKSRLRIVESNGTRPANSNQTQVNRVATLETQLDGRNASALMTWEEDGGRPIARPPIARKRLGRAIRNVAMIGTHTPRRCGIATFTSDLIEAIASESPELDCFVVAMNDRMERAPYPKRVHFEIAEGDIDSYRRAADYLNFNAVDVVSVQHEYGIFGGESGDHILALLRDLRMPIVTTLHTILSTPSPGQRAVMTELARLSERLVVMSKIAAKLLRDVHGVPNEKIDVIPHGIPHLPPASSSKKRIGVEANRVMLTFGLISPDKGIEYVIDALPAILEEFPNTVYIVLGATHPHVKEKHGESYRLMLQAQARRLGVAASVIFYDRFVRHEELTAFLAAADVYITPYLGAEQITSGTLAYALGSGKAVISTPYLYAKELLADGRGTLVPWRDSAAIAGAAIDLFGNDQKRKLICERAATYGRGMAWPAVAHAYLQSFDRAQLQHSRRTRTVFQAKTVASRGVPLPSPNFSHMKLMTDNTGLLQHASFGVPRYEDGYSLDDNARALIVMTLAEDLGTEDSQFIRTLASRYTAFVRYAWNSEVGRFRNFMSYSRTWQESAGSEDSHGRAIQALGTVVGRSTDPGRKNLCGTLFNAALPALETFSSPRAWAFALLGIDEYLKAFEGDSTVQAVRRTMAERLLHLFERTSEEGWPWFEDRLAYCNASLSQAILRSGSSMGRKDMIDAGVRSLDWLLSLQLSSDGYFSPVGSDAVFIRGGQMARFAQQPVEAATTLSACLDARRITGEIRWATRGRQAFDWFLGCNDSQEILYDAATGACRDGIEEDRLNENQGAESTVSFLLSLLQMRAAGQLFGPVYYSQAADSREDRVDRTLSAQTFTQRRSEATA